MYFINIKKVTGFGYRERRVVGPFITVSYENGDETDRTHRELCRKAGVMPDNHQAFVLEFPDCTLAVEFSDWRAIVGRGVCPR